tara:strand:+ start:499 stop:1761 length:1263 start_codon:yes stop_codon:yes gene_type:complete
VRRLPAILAASMALLLLGEAFIGPALADGAPWRRRRRPGVTINHRAESIVNPADWPAEPRTPDTIDPERFARALRELCGWMPPSRPATYTEYFLRHAEAFEVDPFLLAALAHRMGRCRSDAEGMGGLGLTLIPSRMYWDDLRGGTYRYHVRGPDGQWIERSLELDRYPFSGPRLQRPEENIYFAAGLLSAWREQHQSVDATFEQHAHRHYVSHFIWGDRVRTDRSEDRILTDRRRMLQYYGATGTPRTLSRLGETWGAPLDGEPRVVSSWIGAERDGGARNHRGVDVESVLGEPVRAVAAGRVNFAGVDLPGHRNSEGMTPAEIEEVPRDSLGAGGRYVCVLHHPEGEGGPAWLRSCYMHLEDVNVRHGDVLERGDLIGTVGRTGMRRSAPHLHLELHGPDGLMDASEVLSGILIGTPPE